MTRFRSPGGAVAIASLLSIAVGLLPAAADLSHSTTNADAAWGINGSQVLPVVQPTYRSNPAYAWCPGHGFVVTGAAAEVWQLTTGAHPLWQLIAPSSPGPGERTGAGGVHDSARDRFVIFGGRFAGVAYNEAWALSLSGSPSWSLIAAAGTAPSKRYQCASIYDPLRDRLLVFGGRGLAGSQKFNEVWSLTLGGTPTWSLLTTAGAPPTARNAPAAIYDASRDRMIVHAGETATGASRETWALDLSLATPQWTLLDTTGVAALSAYAVYDPTRDRMVVWGGSARAFDLASATWSTISVATPLSQSNTAVAYDPGNDAMVVFGGDGTTDAWTLLFAEPPRWLRHPRVKPSSPGTPVTGGSGVYDAQRDRLVMWDPEAQNEPTYFLPLNGIPTWTVVPATGHPTGGIRDGHRFVHDTARDRYLMFGGRYDFGPPAFNDLWAFPAESPYMWLQQLPGGPLPPARYRHGLIYDPVRDRLIVAGGLMANGTRLSDVWELPLGGSFTWSQLALPGAPPSIGDCQAAYDAVRDRMILVSRGGTWALSLAATPAWTQLSPDSTMGPSFAIDSSRDRLVAADIYPPGLHALQLPGPGSWSPLESTGDPGYYFCNDCTVKYQPGRDRLVVNGFETLADEQFGWYPIYETWFVHFGPAQSVCASVAQVVSFTQGSDTWWPSAEDAIGTHDYVPLTLGSGGSATFRLDHPVGDGPGYDFYVHENGGTEADVEENYSVEASLDGAAFVSLGNSPGGMRGFDLANSGLAAARFIRITDLAPTEATVAGMAGADIDAIEIVHCSESVAVEGAAPKPIERHAIVQVRPNPGTGTQAFDLRLAPGGANALAIYTADGRRVWSRDLRGLESGAHVVVWDGRASNGRPVSPSVYFARLEGLAGESAVRRIVRVR